MKVKIRSILLAVTATAGITLLGPVACHEDAEPPPADAAEAAFSVEGMTCAACDVTVRTAAKDVDGVYDARADADEGRAWASYDPKRTSPGAIARAIRDAGYPASPIEAGRDPLPVKHDPSAQPRRDVTEPGGAHRQPGSGRRDRGSEPPASAPGARARLDSGP